MNKVGHNSEFLFGVCWWIWKTNIYYQKLLKWANKKQNNFNIYKAAFFFKKSPWRYHYFTPVYQKSRWYDLQFLRCRAWQTEIGIFRSFFPFYPLQTPKNQNFENKKKIAVDIIILHMFTKKHNYMMSGSLDTEWDKQNFLSFWAIFALLLPPPNNPENQNFEKMRKIPGDIILHICTINENHYDVWFLRYGAQQTKFVVFLGHFLPLATRKIIILKKWKKILQI